ncbi:MAG: hypothetical protein HW416_1668 [Chloroflexi bacterium]|nr:hypothetical protein [Chloroflexota bacterium]
MARIVSQELPSVPTYYTLQATPHLATLSGPTATVPDTTGSIGWNIVNWELR